MDSLDSVRMEVIVAVPGVEFVVDVEMEAAAGHEAGVEVAAAVGLGLGLGLGTGLGTGLGIGTGLGAAEVVENVVDAGAGAGVGYEAEGIPEVAAALVHVLDAAVIAG